MKNRYNLRIDERVHVGHFICSAYKSFDLEKNANNYEEQTEIILKLIGKTVDVIELDGTVINHGMIFTSVRKTKVGKEIVFSVRTHDES